MFGISRKKKIEKLNLELRELQYKYYRVRGEFTQILDMYNKLVRRINAKGGESFLNSNPQKPKAVNPFSQDEIDTLIRLCHPDKHNNKDSAKVITQKLLTMRV